MESKNIHKNVGAKKSIIHNQMSDLIYNIYESTKQEAEQAPI